MPKICQNSLSYFLLFKLTFFLGTVRAGMVWGFETYKFEGYDLLHHIIFTWAKHKYACWKKKTTKSYEWCIFPQPKKGSLVWIRYVLSVLFYSYQCYFNLLNLSISNCWFSITRVTLKFIKARPCYNNCVQSSFLDTFPINQPKLEGWAKKTYQKESFEFPFLYLLLFIRACIEFRALTNLSYSVFYIHINIYMHKK